MTVSCDLNYRKNLWKYGKEAKEVMSELTKYVDVAIANEEDFQKSLGISAKSDVESGELDRDVYKQIAQTAMDLYPNLKKVAITLRESKSADTNYWAACIYDGKEFYVSRKYAITDIVDRVGGGDSFGGGLIYGLNTYATQAEALEFAVAGFLPEAHHLRRLQPRDRQGSRKPDEGLRLRPRRALSKRRTGTQRCLALYKPV